MKTASFYQRLTAKGIDFFLVIYVSRTEHAFWIFLSILYLLMSDGFFQGQSLGKRIVGLKTMYLENESKEYFQCTFFQSVIRNSAFASILLLSVIPFVGVVFAILGFVFILIEIYFMYTDSENLRIGDIYAKTKVLQAQVL